MADSLSKEVPMNLFWQLVKQSFRQHLTYRAATIAGLFTNFFFGLFRVAVLLALLGERPSIEGYDATGLITYTALTQALIGIVSIFSWSEVMDSVYSGSIGAELLKPMNFYRFWLARDLGRALLTGLLRGILFMLLFEIPFDLSYPETAVQWLSLLLMIALGWYISFGYRFLLNLAAFWTPQAIGLVRFGFVIAWFFSGFLMPLRLFPDWVQTIANWTPFPHLLNSAVEVYVGIISGPTLLQLLLIQLAWGVGLMLIGQLVLKTAVRRLVILGG
jgi:ABC-2 type transport system permease protein